MSMRAQAGQASRHLGTTAALQETLAQTLSGAQSSWLSQSGRAHKVPTSGLTLQKSSSVSNVRAQPQRGPRPKHPASHAGAHRWLSSSMQIVPAGQQRVPQARSLAAQHVPPTQLPPLPHDVPAALATQAPPWHSRHSPPQSVPFAFAKQAPPSQFLQGPHWPHDPVPREFGPQTRPAQTATGGFLRFLRFRLASAPSPCASSATTPPVNPASTPRREAWEERVRTKASNRIASMRRPFLSDEATQGAA